MPVPLLVGNTLSDLGNLGYKYDETNQRNELARYMHDRLSAAEAQRGGLERQRLSDLKELGLKPYSEMTKQQAEQLAIAKKAIDDQRRNQMIQGIVGLETARRPTSEQVMQSRTLTGENLAKVAEATAFRDKLKLDLDRWVPNEIREKYKEGGTEWFGGGGLWDKNALAEANRQTMARYGQWIDVDPLGVISPRTVAPSVLPPGTASILERMLAGDDTAVNELINGGKPAAPVDRNTTWIIDPNTHQPVLNPNYQGNTQTVPNQAPPVVPVAPEKPPAPGIAPGFGRF